MSLRFARYAPVRLRRNSSKPCSARRSRRDQCPVAARHVAAVPWRFREDRARPRTTYGECAGGAVWGGAERARREVQLSVVAVCTAMGLTGVYTQLRHWAERSRRTSVTEQPGCARAAG
jgi:hypothetical protein